MKIFELFGEILLKDNGIENKLDKIDKKASQTDTGMSNAFGKIGGSALKLGAIIGGGLGIVGAIKKSYDFATSASDLSEAQNVLQTTFKTSGKEIEAWTNTTTKSAGISKTNSTQWAGFMGAMLKSSGVSEKASGDMSKSLVQLTGDMSSFYNVSTSDMWEKLRSGISGETEPLKAIGINMSVANLEAYALATGIKKTYKDMSQGEQTQLRYNYLMKVTADAQGDFGKTLSTSFANQVRVAKLGMEDMGRSIGTKLLPLFQKGVTFINDHMPQIQKVIDVTMMVIGKAFELVGIYVKGTLIPIFKAFYDWIKPYMPQIKQAVADAFVSMKIIMKGLSDFINTYVIPIFIGLKDWFVKNFPAIKDAVLQAYNYIKPSFDNLVKVIKENVMPIILGLWGVVEKAMPGIKAIFEVVFKVLVWLIKTIIDDIANFIEVVKAVYDFIKPSLDLVAEIFSAVFGGIKKVIEGVQKVLDFFNGTPVKDKEATIKFNEKTVKEANDKGGYRGGYASGTPNATPGAHWVGEEGPEIVNFEGGETVTNAKDSAKIAANKNPQPTIIQLVLASGKVIAEFMIDDLNKLMGGKNKIAARSVGL
jgi:hypothetical protein